MSEYGQGAIDLLEILGVDAEMAVGDLMDKLKTNQDFANAQIRTLTGMLDRTIAEHKAHLELIDEVASRHDISVKCRSCDEYYLIDWELSLYDPHNSYCGRSDRCCP